MFMKNKISADLQVIKIVNKDKTNKQIKCKNKLLLGYFLEKNIDACMIMHST